MMDWTYDILDSLYIIIETLKEIIRGNGGTQLEFLFSIQQIRGNKGQWKLDTQV